METKGNPSKNYTQLIVFIIIVLGIIALLLFTNIIQTGLSIIFGIILIVMIAITVIAVVGGFASIFKKD